MKLKYKDIPKLRTKLMKGQNYKCMICDRDLRTLKSREVCLDHNHKTGKIRGVLCRGCNSMEGKTWRTFQRMGLAKAGVDYEKFLRGLAGYSTWDGHDIIHPKFKEKNVKTKTK
jgi:hypothetical protein